MHSIVDAVATAARLALDAIERRRVHHRSVPSMVRRARLDEAEIGVSLRGVRSGAEEAGSIRARRRLTGIIPGDDPGARNGILAEFHK